MTKKLIAIIALVVIASLSVAGCVSSTNSNQAASSSSQAASSAASTTATSASTTTKAAAFASATPTPSIVPTPPITILPLPTPAIPTPTPTPVPKPQCTHVEIIIFHPLGTPCNTCAATNGELGIYYRNNPYVTTSVQNATANSMVGIVRETGQTQSFTWGDVTQIEAWTDSVLTCK